MAGSRVDIGIVSYGCFRELEGCLKSIVSKKDPVLNRVIVIENGPKEPPSHLKDQFPGVEFLKARSNLGFAKGCNQIISKTNQDYICLLNPDTVVQGPFLAEATSWMERHRDVAVLGPKILEPDGSIQGSARYFPGIHTAFFGRTSWISRKIPDNPFTRKNLVQTSLDGDLKYEEVDWVSGACMFIRRKAINEVGPMDEGFFMYWEDCDWCTRFRQAGWKVVYHPGIGPVVHITGTSSKTRRLSSLYHFHRSALRLSWKYDTTPLHIYSALAMVGLLLRFCILGTGVALSGLMFRE